MKKLTLEALNKSIAHWERLATGKRMYGEKAGVEHCALCSAFNTRRGAPTDCIGCPVMERTGKQFCVGTPYDDVDEIRDSFAGDDAIYDSDEFLWAAEAELEFLRSLLPKKAKQKKTKP